MGCASSNVVQEEENSKNINSKSRNQNQDVIPNKSIIDKDINTLQNNNTKEKTVSQQKKSRIMIKENCLKNKNKYILKNQKLMKKRN